MIKENIHSKDFLEHNYAAPWEENITYEEWNNFLNHNFNYGRVEAYKVLMSFIRMNSLSKQQFCEIGFGQCYDFHNCFKSLDDQNKIIYDGYEITEQFVKFARIKYNDLYSFEVGSFDILKDIEYDIIYTRHVLEHQHPDNCYKYFENILKSAQKLAIIVWFKNPGKEDFTWNNRDGNGKGAYVNTYSKDKLTEMIKDYNFNFSQMRVEHNNIMNTVYILKKDK